MRLVALINHILGMSDSPSEWILLLAQELTKLYPEESTVETFLLEFGAKRKYYIRRTLLNLLRKPGSIDNSNSLKLTLFLRSVREHIEQLIKESELLPEQIETMFRRYHQGLYYDGIAQELEQIAMLYPTLGKHNPLLIDYHPRKDGVLQLGLYEADRLSSLPIKVVKRVSIGGYSRQITEKVPDPIIIEQTDLYRASFNHRAREIALRETVRKYFPNLLDKQITCTPTEEIPDEVLETNHFSYLFGTAYQYLFEAQE